MPKAYWVSCYRSVADEAALARYAKIAGPAIESKGGRILARGRAAHVFEAGLAQRTVVIEFADLATAVAAYESAEYRVALAELGDAAERDVRIVEGV